jgi:hypothetical protein
MQENFYDFAKMTLAVRRSRFRFWKPSRGGKVRTADWRANVRDQRGQLIGVNRNRRFGILLHAVTRKAVATAQPIIRFHLPRWGLATESVGYRTHGFLETTCRWTRSLKFAAQATRMNLPSGVAGKRTRTHRSGCDTHAVTMTVGDVAGSQKPPAESRLFLLAEAHSCGSCPGLKASATSGGPGRFSSESPFYAMTEHPR